MSDFYQESSEKFRDETNYILRRETTAPSLHLAVDCCTSKMRPVGPPSVQ